MRARDVMVIEADTIKPQKPLTPEQSRKRSEKQVNVQRQVQDEDRRHVARSAI
jgi:hypothetical protein